MESHSYSSYPESHDSSPRSREIECENSVASWEEQAIAPSAARVKLMISYGGRIQPRQHDNQLTYVGGETKILAVDRSVRFPVFLSRLAPLLPAGSPAELCFKYQLPGEDLDALISVTNDEDLEHMMIEYDRLVRSAVKPAPRLRLFLFPLTSPSAPNSVGSAGSEQQKPDRQQWFLDALNSLPQPHQQVAHPPPMLDAIQPAAASPDFLFGLDSGFVPPPSVKIKDTTPEPTVMEPLSVDVTARSDPGSKEERQVGEAVGSPAEMQRQIQELQMLQIAENQKLLLQQQQQQLAAAAAFQRNDTDEALAARGLAGEYYLPRAQEKQQIPSQAAPAPAQYPQAAYWPEQMSIAAAGRYASMAGGDQPVYFIPAGRGVYPGAGGGMHPQAYYAVPRMVPAEEYRDASAMYAVAAAAAAQPQQAGKVVGGGATAVAAAQDGSGYSMAYDSAGRTVYYTSAVPTYQTGASVGPMNQVVEGNKVAVKPPQVS